MWVEADVFSIAPGGEPATTAEASLGNVASMRVVRWATMPLLGSVLFATLFGALSWIATGESANVTAAPEESTTTLVTDTTVPVAPPTALGPLILSPSGCVVPAPALAVFRGRVININDPPTTAQFRVLKMLAGSQTRSPCWYIFPDVPD